MKERKIPLLDSLSIIIFGVHEHLRNKDRTENVIRDRICWNPLILYECVHVSHVYCEKVIVE